MSFKHALKTVKSLIYKLDFFYTKELLRYKSETQYRTVFGGCSSLILVVLLSIVFFYKLYEIANSVGINAQQSRLEVGDPTPYTISTSDKKFMFGLRLSFNNQLTYYSQNLDRYQHGRLFDIFVVGESYIASGEGYDYSQTFFKLEQCQYSHWENFPLIFDQLHTLQFYEWLCPPKDLSFQIQGKFSSEVQKFLRIELSQCSELQDQTPCFDAEMREEILNEFGFNERSYMSLYFVNALLNPSDKDHLSYYLEDRNYIQFTSSVGTETSLYLEEYNIKSDESMFPNGKIKQQVGASIPQVGIKNPVQTTGQFYSSFTFTKSAYTRNIERKFQKLDDIFSYIGGLFGFAIFFLFLVSTYNSHSYEISLGSNLFRPQPVPSQDQSEENTQKQEDQNQLKKYNFLKFIRQLVYNFITFFKCKINCGRSTKLYEKCQLQMTKQLDILFLLKRISFLERAIEVIFDEKQLTGLYLQEQHSIKEMKIRRKKFRHKRKIISKIQLSNQTQKQKTKGKQKSIIKVQPLLESSNLNLVQKSQVQKRQIKAIEDKLQQAIQSSQKIEEKPEKLMEVALEELMNSDSSESEDQTQDKRNMQNDIKNQKKAIRLIRQLMEQKNKGNKKSALIWQKIDPKIRYKFAPEQRMQDIKKKWKIFEDKINNNNQSHPKK